MRRLAALLAALLLAVPLAAQDGRYTIAEIVVEGAGERAGDVRAALQTKVGEVFDPAAPVSVNRDLEFLWQRMRVRCERVLMEPLDGGRVRLVFRVVPVPTLRRVVFEGNQEFEWDRLQLETGLAGAQEIDLGSLPRVINALADFYRGEGYALVQITPEVEEERQQVRLRIDEGPLVRIGDVQFRGHRYFPSWTLFSIGNDLEGTLEGGDGWLLFPGKKFNPEVIQRDIVALEKLYHDYGFLQAQVRLAEQSYYRSNKRVRLVYEIEEGPQYTVRQVLLEPADPATPLQVPVEELQQVIELKPGMPFELDRVENDRALLQKFYGRLGHPAAARGRGEINDGFFRFGPPYDRAEVFFPAAVAERAGEVTAIPEGTEVFAPPAGASVTYRLDGTEVDVIYKLQEGRPMRVADVLVQGNTHTRDEVVRREISLEPGDLADTEEAIRSWRRLLALQYFTDPETRAPYVNWWFTAAERQDWVDLYYEVAEGDTGRLLFGGGINTSTGPFLSLTIQKQNFDLFDPPSSLGRAFPEILDGQAFTGRGQTLDLFLAPGTQFSQYRLTFTEPDLFGDHIDRWGLTTNLFKSIFFLDTHDETRTGAKVTLRRNFGRYFQVYGTPELQRVEIEDPEPGAPAILRETLGGNSLQGVGFGAQYNTVEDPFNPVGGGRVGLYRRQIGEFFGGDWDFYQNTLDAAKYFRLWEDSKGRPFVLALEGTVQWGAETGELSGIPYSERFFLGGQRTLRGFDFRGVGPRNDAFPLGGEAAWYATTEFRFPLVSSRVRGQVDEVEYIRGGVFVDYGSVGSALDALGPTRVAAGVDLRMRIPFLPGLGLQLDFGWPLRSEPFDDERVFSFELGMF